MLKYIAVIGLALYVLKLTGFCFSQFDWKSDRELVEAALQFERSAKPDIADIQAYLRDFPQCCSVRNPHDDIFINAVFGRRFYRVSVKYPVVDVVANDGQPFYESILIMDCCGEYVPDRGGMAFAGPIPAGPPAKVERIRRN